MNFHMNGLKKMLAELQGMLNTADVSLRKAPGHVMTVQKGKKQKRPARLRNLLKVRLLGRQLRPKKRIKRLAPFDDVCFHCGVKGHWLRNCKKYMEEKKKNRGATSTQGIDVIEINLATCSNNA